MYCLIKKELTSNIRYMLTGLAFFILYAFIFSNSGSGLFSLCLIFCFYAVSTTNMILDERYKIDLLMTTLPLRRSTVVRSKYFLVAVIYCICFVLYTFMFVVGRLAGYSGIPMLGIESATLALFSVSIYNGVTLPLFYKFGAQAMRYVALGIFFGFFFLGSALGHLNITGFASFFGNLGPIGFGLVLLGASVIINVVSYLISNSIYSKKDL